MVYAQGCRALFGVSVALACNFLFIITPKSTLGLCWGPWIADLVAERLIKATSPGNSTGKADHDEDHSLSGAQAFIKPQSTGTISGDREIFSSTFGTCWKISINSRLLSVIYGSYIVWSESDTTCI